MRTPDEITNNEDIIDSRDVIARIEYLESSRDDLESDNNLAEWEDSDESLELDNLKALADEAAGYASDWHYGATLIRESYFTNYCRDLVQDIGDLPRELPAYIEDNIDWDGVADDLQVDYTSVDFDGITYYVR